MKKIISIFLTFILIVSLAACDPITTPTDNTDGDDNQNTVDVMDHLDLYYINDTHGAILQNSEQMGLANIGNLVLTQKQANPNETLFLAGGDILQGNVLSNYFYGASTIDILNEMQLDVFVLGNHEFDWGLETVTKYFRDDVQSDVKANFPLLGANVFYDGTYDRPEGVDAYAIIQKGDLKIGVIGVVGTNIESSIATAMIDPYYFDDAAYWTGYYAEYLRTVEQVDMVIAIDHDDSDGYNQQVAALEGNSYVDVIFNGHSHYTYVDSFDRDPQTCYVVQSGANGENVGNVHFTIADGLITDVTAKNLNQTNEILLNSPNQDVADKIDTYVTQIEPLLNETIITTGESMSRGDLTTYMAKLMRLKTGADIAFHNYGGTRTSVDYHQDVTVATLYEIFPFDNVIKTVYLKGSDVKSFMTTSDGSYYDTNVTNFEDDTYYLVATNDYVFDKEYYPFIYGNQIDATGILLRNVLEDALRNMALTYEYFYLDNPITFTE